MLVPPLKPMLARLARDLPTGDYLYEPKWDGFRCLAFVDGDDVDLRSRHDRPLSRYFPEVVEAIRSLPDRQFVLDGELVVAGPAGLDFEALLARLHPAASRVERLRRATPACLVAFDVVAVGDEDLRTAPFVERRRRLERLLAGALPALLLTPMTDDPRVAADWLERFHGAGVDGVIAKASDLAYLPAKRAMVKVKRDRTVDCVVAGYRPFVDSPLVASLLLGLYDRDGALIHVGVASSFTDAERRSLRDILGEFRVPLEGHPWEHGFLLGPNPSGRLAGSASRWTPDMERDWIPLRPELACEVAVDRLDGVRLRHPARFQRWRPDRDARSCALDQLEAPGAPVADLLATA